MTIYIIFWVWFSLTYRYVFTLDSCSSHLKCQDCIRDSSLCVWCPTDTFNGTRCRSQNSSENNWCPEEDRLENPKNFRNASVNLEFNANPEHIVQVKPQKYKMKLRPGKPAEFSFVFKDAIYVPVDLYFLLDASSTMSSMKNLTAEQSEKIYVTIDRMTENVHLGYGTFVDKRAFPFTNTFNIEETYSFRHRLALTKNFRQFKETIRTTPVGKNRGAQKGGLDALAQVMACPDIIKWRRGSRKIIVFLTDAHYHAAGDGRTAGIFKPYDGNCYTHNDTYTKELEMDYPSVGIINKLAVDQNINIFFYVEEKVIDVYKNLSSVISGSKVASFTNNMAKKSPANNSMADTLKEIYEKFYKTIILKKYIQKKNKKNIDINFKPNCVSDVAGPECDVEGDKEKHFNGTIKVLEYNGYDNITVDIAVESFGEKLTLNIEVIKDCNCQNIGVEKNSIYCHGEPRICGECSCGNKRYGERCVCEKTGEVLNYTSSCIQPGESDACSGHGNCECGACRCRIGYSGKFCQCNDLSCPLGDGKLCSGEKQGKCQCGKCNCAPGWEGNACQCSKYNCVIDGKQCNGRGRCICGRCDCDPIAKWDKRSVPDKNCRVVASAGSHSLQCKALEDCAKCHRTNKNSDCISCDDAFQTRVVEFLTEEYLNSSVWNTCPAIKVVLGCYSNFVYRYDDSKYVIELLVERRENCAKTYYLFGGIFFVVLVVVGVLTLVAWKLLTDARDRLEYKQFLEKTKTNNIPVKNPLYVHPTSSFTNPRFRQRSHM